MNLPSHWKQKDELRRAKIKKRQQEHARALGRKARKLSDAEVRRAREAHGKGYSYRSIADILDVSLGTIQNLLTGKTYKDIK